VAYVDFISLEVFPSGSVGTFHYYVFDIFFFTNWYATNNDVIFPRVLFQSIYLFSQTSNFGSISLTAFFQVAVFQLKNRSKLAFRYN